VVLLDDIGFGQSSAFGGPIRMPTLDKLASEGLRYNNFHTTALCSPTRTALLTGRCHRPGTPDYGCRPYALSRFCAPTKTRPLAIVGTANLTAFPATSWRPLSSLA